MKGLPIIMDGNSVRAILAGRKTQMRKVIDPQPPKGQGCNLLTCRKKNYKGQDSLSFFWGVNQEGSRQPAYQPGDLLWVKESYMFWDWTEDGDPFIKYKSDGALRLCDACGGGDEFAQMERAERIGNIWSKLSEHDNYVKHDYKARDNGWRSPLAMFKHFARIWLRVDDVRAERLQDTDAAGIIGEGVFQEIEDDPGYDNLGVAQGVFGAVWDRLNAKKGYPWEDNPWVWVYEFKLERIVK